MPFSFTIPGAATTEVLLSGQPLTALEAMLYLGFVDVAKKVARLRHSGFPIEARDVPFKTVLERIETTLGAPVPTHVCARVYAGEMTEYFVPAEFVASPLGLRAAAKAKADRLAAEAAAEATWGPQRRHDRDGGGVFSD